ncbi:MAG: hypothetical protein MJD61_12305, partial [Proteobacteria bacterium]|nr:hypothetical protein [Pseudomonadota bacterium]
MSGEAAHPPHEPAPAHTPMQDHVPSALLSDPNLIFAYLSGVLALVFWASGLPALRKLFTVTPPLIYAYFIP